MEVKHVTELPTSQTRNHYKSSEWVFFSTKKPLAFFSTEVCELLPFLGEFGFILCGNI